MKAFLLIFLGGLALLCSTQVHAQEEPAILPEPEPELAVLEPTSADAAGVGDDQLVNLEEEAQLTPEEAADVAAIESGEAIVLEVSDEAIGDPAQLLQDMMAGPEETAADVAADDAIALDAIEVDAGAQNEVAADAGADVAIEVHAGAQNEVAAEQQNREKRSTPQDDAKQLAQYNRFMDVFYRQLTNKVRQNMNPLKIYIRRKNAPLKKGKAGAKKNKNNVNKNKKRMQQRSHPRDVAIDAEEVEEEEEEAIDLESRVKREVAELDQELEDDDEEGLDDDEEELSRDKRDAPDTELIDEEEENEEDLAEVEGEDREGRQRKKKGGACKKKCKANRRRRRLRAKRKRLRMQKRRRQQQKAAAIRTQRSLGAKAEVKGLATLRRVGDVRIATMPKAQHITSDFEIGPITMKLFRKGGAKGAVSVRNSEATATKVDGTIVISINRNGDARLTKFYIRKPDNVQVVGSLRLDDKFKDHFSQNSFMIAKSTIAKRLKMMAIKTLRRDDDKQSNNKKRQQQNKKN